jgi:hypothetical protein
MRVQMMAAPRSGQLLPIAPSCVKSGARHAERRSLLSASF